MTDVFDRVRAANPVPDSDRYYESLSGKGRQLFRSTSDRRNHMTVDQIDKLEQPRPKQPQPRFRGWRVAIAGAAAVVALVVGFTLVFTGGGDDVAVPTNLEIAEQFVESLGSGDVLGYESLVSADAITDGEPFFGQPSSGWAYGSGFQAATGGTYTAECRETPASPATDVVCTMAETNVFREAAGLDPNRYDWSFVIENGVITQLSGGGDLIFQAFDQIIAYDGWVQANYPDEYAGLMGIPQFILDIAGSEDQTLLPMPLVDTETQRTRHAELSAEWAASLS